MAGGMGQCKPLGGHKIMLVTVIYIVEDLLCFDLLITVSWFFLPLGVRKYVICFWFYRMLQLRDFELLKRSWISRSVEKSKVCETFNIILCFMSWHHQGILGDKWERKGYGLIVVNLCVKVTRGQLYCLVFLSAWPKVAAPGRGNFNWRTALDWPRGKSVGGGIFLVNLEAPA